MASDSDSPYIQARERIARSQRFVKDCRAKASANVSAKQPLECSTGGASSSAAQGGSSSSNQGIRLVENRYGAFDVFSADKPVGRLTCWPSTSNGVLQFAAKCEAHKGCTIMYNANSYPGQSALIQWLVDGLGQTASRHRQMRPTK